MHKITTALALLALSLYATAQDLATEIRTLEVTPGIYMLDGANITDPVTGTFSANFNYDAIEQIEVILGGYMPEYGQSLGGIVNIVTQSARDLKTAQSSFFELSID